jgi:hypothetical protein
LSGLNRKPRRRGAYRGRRRAHRDQRFPEQPIRRFALEHLAVGFAEHLDMTKRVVPFIRAEVEIIEPERFWNTVGLACFEIARKAALLWRM